MRSRDGLQIVCVICEDKPKKPEVISLTKDDAVSDLDIFERLLEILARSLKSDESAQPIQSFLTVLEAAMPAIVEASCDFSVKRLGSVIEEIREKIRLRIMKTLTDSHTSCTEIVVNQFQISSRLLKCLREFPKIE